MKNWKNYLTESNLFYSIVGLLYYLQIRLYVGALDDIHYTYMHKVVDGRMEDDYTHRIGSLWEAIQSQCVDYFYQNGRFIVHSLVQWLCGINYGRELFFIISTIAFISLVAGLTKLIEYSRGHSKYTKYAVLILLLVLSPSIGFTVFGNVSFVVNYLWTSALIIWSLINLRQILFCNRKYGTIESIGLWIYVFIAFAFQESFSIPIAGAIGICALVHYRDWNWYKFSFLLAVGLGTLLIAISPSNFSRFAASGGTGDSGIIMHVIINVIGLFYVSELACVSILALLILLIFYRKQVWPILHRNAFYIIGIVISFSFGIIAVTAGAHQFFVAALLLIIVLISELQVYFMSSRISAHVSVIRNVVIGLLLVCNVPVYVVRNGVYNGWNEYKNTIVKDGYAHADQLFFLNERFPFISHNYTMYRQCAFHFHKESASCAALLFRSVLSHSIDEHDCCSLPLSKEKIMAYCAKNTPIKDNIWLAPDGSGYIVRVPTYMKDSVQLQYITPPTFWGKLIHRPDKKMNYELSKFSPQEFVMDGMSYRWISGIEPKYIKSIQVVRK